MPCECGRVCVRVLHFECKFCDNNEENEKNERKRKSRKAISSIASDEHNVLLVVNISEANFEWEYVLSISDMYFAHSVCVSMCVYTSD